MIDSSRKDRVRCSGIDSEAIAGSASARAMQEATRAIRAFTCRRSKSTEASRIPRDPIHVSTVWPDVRSVAVGLWLVRLDGVPFQGTRESRW
jgi:hypothetical protein